LKASYHRIDKSILALVDSLACRRDMLRNSIMSQSLFAVVLLGALLGGFGEASAQPPELRGRVVDEAGNPVKGASVELQPIFPVYDRSLEVMDGLIFPEPERRVRTSAAGEYVLPVPEPGMWYVEIWADGKITLRHKLVPLLETEVLPPAVLTADLGLEVRVQDEQGNALPGAKVWLAPDTSDERELESQRRARSEGWEARGRIGDTDDTGRVRLSRRAGQPLVAYGYAIGFLPSQATPVTGDSVTLRLERGLPYEIRLFEPDGDPAAAVLVQIGDPSWNHATTDEDGRVQVYLQPEVTLAFGMITPDGQLETGTLAASEEELAQGPEEYEELTLPEPVVLEGIVLDDRYQEPIAGAWVWSVRDPGHIVLTDRRGRYRLIRGSGSRWWIEAAAPGYRPASTLAQRDGAEISSTSLLLSRASGLGGRVVDADGNGVDSAEIVAYPVDGSGGASEPPKAFSGQDGTFDIRGLAAEETYDLVVTAPGFAEKRQVIQPSQTDPLVIVLTQGRSVRGRLVSAQGAAVVGGEVALIPTPDAWRQMAVYPRQRREYEPPTGVSDAEGRFRIDNLPDGPLGAVVTAYDHATKLVPHVDFPAGADAADLGDLVLVPSVRLHGVVVDSNDNPIAGARVEANRSTYFWSIVNWILEGRRESPGVVTDESGRFAFDGFEAGERLSILVHHADYLHQMEQEIEAGADTPVRIVLDRGGRISGRVVTDTGEPLQDFEVQARSRRSQEPGALGRGFSGGDTTTTRTIEEGTFELPNVTPGTVSLTGRGGGYITAQPLEVELRSGQEITEVVLRLRPASELAGRVTDESGRPVVQAQVSLNQDKPSRFSTVSDHIGNTVTNADGNYRIDNLDATAPSLVLSVSHDEYSPLTKQIELEPGVNRLDLVLESGLSIAGFVVSATGEPIAGASVALEGGQGGIHDRQSSTLSLDDGSFEITGVAPGTYKIFAMKEGYARSFHPQPVDVAGSGVRDLTLRMTRGGTIRGRIVGIEPQDLDRVHISANDGESQFAMGVADGSGEYRIDNVAFSEGTVRGVSQETGRAVSESFTLDTDGGETWIDLEFRTGGSTLSGYVLVDGEPAAQMQVVARGGLEGAGTASTDRSGRFEMQGLDDGRYTISLFGSYPILEAEVVDVAGDTEVTIDLSTSRIAGRVVDAATGEPIADAMVRIHNEAGWFGMQGSETVTDSSGAFEIILAAEGKTVAVEARADGFAHQTVPIEVLPGERVTGVEVALESGGELELEVLLASGLRPQYVGIGVTDASGRTVFADSLYGTGWVHRLRSIPPGDWRLLVMGQGGGTVAVPISVPGPPVSVTLPSEAKIVLDLTGIQGLTPAARVRLLTPSGEPFGFPIGGSILYEQPLTSTRQTLRWLAPGNWIVELIDASGQSRQQPVTTIAGQTTEIVMN